MILSARARHDEFPSPESHPHLSPPVQLGVVRALVPRTRKRAKRTPGWYAARVRIPPIRRVAQRVRARHVQRRAPRTVRGNAPELAGRAVGRGDKRSSEILVAPFASGDVDRDPS